MTFATATGRVLRRLVHLTCARPVVTLAVAGLLAAVSVVLADFQVPQNKVIWEVTEGVQKCFFESGRSQRRRPSSLADLDFSAGRHPVLRSL